MRISKPQSDSSLPKGKVKIMYLSSCGGHLVQLLKVARGLAEPSSMFVVNDRTDLADIMRDRTVLITHAERNLKQIYNFLEALIVVLTHRPKVFISTGAAPAIPFGLVCRVIGCRVIFIESLSRITSPSLTAKFMYYIANDFYIQWKPLKKFFPKAKYLGSLL